jgi:hypothetical protein
MSLFANVPVPADTRYFAVKVVLPGVSPVTKTVALARTSSLPATSSACESVGAVDEPAGLAANDMKDLLPPVLPCCALVRITSAFPEVGMVTVTNGPVVARLV